MTNSPKGGPSPLVTKRCLAARFSARHFARVAGRIFFPLTWLRLRKLRAIRRAAFEAHRDALRRGDRRDQHYTRGDLYKATTDVMRAEGRW